jgi:hypothetical protein
MASIAQLRSGLATALGTLPGVRVYQSLPDEVNVPAALVSFEKVTFDKASGRAVAVYTFKVTIAVGRTVERVAQSNLDLYVDQSSKQSVKVALEADPTLGGVAYDVYVPELSAYGGITLNGIDYLGAEFSVTIYAS